MTDPYYQDERVTLWHGDCLDVLATLPDASVDSVVTDPPYNLSAPKGRDECLSRAVAQIVLPDDHERDSEGFEGGHLARPSLGRSHLSGKAGSVRVSARIGVPEGAVDLDGPPIIEQEVDASDEPAALATDGDLTTVGDPQPIQLGGHYVLQRADGRDAPFCDGTCRCFTEPGAGLIAVSVVVPCPSCGDGARDGLAVDWRDAHVGLQHDTRRQAECAACVLAGGRAVVRAVLRLDMRSGTGELSLADGAPQGDALFLLRPAGSVGARAGAGGLSAMPETHRICLVGDPADRAFTLHLPFHTHESTGGFMGKEWDGWASPASFERWCRAWAAECLRVLKPGGHLLAFGGTRTWHRLAVAIEDAGFEVRDSIAWLYGSGFPKSMDVGKAIDKAAGAERAVVGSRTLTGTAASSSAHVGNLAGGSGVGAVKVVDVTAPATPDAEQWQGWGTALKPAFEPVVVARKPLEGTVASNVLAWGTGALNIDATRISTEEDRRRNARGGDNGLNGEGTFRIRERRADDQPLTAGRWPANVVLGHTPDCDVIYEGRGEIRLEGPCAPGCPVAELDRQSGESSSRVGKPRGAAHGEGWGMTATGAEYADTGGASRFFYVAKAPTSERPRYSKSVLRLRAGLTPEQVGHVRARLAEAGVRVD